LFVLDETSGVFDVPFTHSFTDRHKYKCVPGLVTGTGETVMRRYKVSAPAELGFMGGG
jgi:hypothetical protein